MKRFLFMILLVCLTGGKITAQQIDTLVISNGERKIFGLLHRPVTNPDTALPLAIVSHGFNGDYRHGCRYFDALGRVGYQCFSFDFPCGSTHSAIDSNTVNMSIRDEQSDLQALVEYFSSCRNVDSDNIILIGESQGGIVTALAGSAIPEKVNKLVLTFAAFCIPNHHNGRFGSVSVIPDTSYVWNVPLGRRFFEELRSMDAFAEMPKFSGPVLLVHGDKDSVVPVADSERAVGIYPNARLKIIKGAGHGFNPEEFELYMSWLTEFLKAN
jgi:pimeloyl-ACP methyl ester carboxylesterase